MGAELPYQICEIGSICRMWRNTQNTHLPCSPISIHIFLAEGDCTHCRDSHCANISIHTFLAEGDDSCTAIHFCCVISIHTFLAEGDGSRMSVWRAIPNFNPHLPRGRWRGSRNKAEAVKLFQSTPSSRKVTCYSCAHWDNCHQFQSTPSSRKVTKALQRGKKGVKFQSTPSSRKVTERICSYQSG